MHHTHPYATSIVVVYLPRTGNWCDQRQDLIQHQSSPLWL